MKNLLYSIPFFTHLLIFCSVLLIFDFELLGFDLIKSQLYLFPITIFWLFIMHIFIQNMDLIRNYLKKSI